MILGGYILAPTVAVIGTELIAFARNPVLYPKMTEMANTAANKGLMQYQQTGDLSSTVVVEGIKFTVPIKFQKGTPYVPTVIPTGLAK